MAIQHVGRFEWEKVMRGQVHAVTYAVASCLASYGDSDTGRKCRPGVKRLAADLQLGPSTVRRHLDTLQKAGWIERVSSGSPSGLRGAADEYRLTVPNHRPQASSGEAEPPPASEHTSPEPVLASEQTSARQRAEPPPASEHPPVHAPDQDQQPAPARDLVPDPNPVATSVATRLGCGLADAETVIGKVLKRKTVDDPDRYIRSIPDADLAARLPTSKPSNGKAPLPPPCGRCDARPGDPPSARVIWLDFARTRSDPCPDCHPSQVVLAHA